MTTAEAKRTLKAKGWSYRSAAPELGVCYQHIALVLTGRRESRRLCQRIAALPPRAGAMPPVVATES